MKRNPVTANSAKPAEDNVPLAVRLPEAVRISGFSRSTLYIMAARGEITFRKAGKSVLVDYASLKRAYEALPTAELTAA